MPEAQAAGQENRASSVAAGEENPPAPSWILTKGRDGVTQVCSKIGFLAQHNSKKCNQEPKRVGV